ncbi:hypothetical protein SESBI_38833 [Sesbania bispinosa]|nr:hypothetical protein SESBI_38833 [Sesbania bispinosa]
MVVTEPLNQQGRGRKAPRLTEERCNCCARRSTVLLGGAVWWSGTTDCVTFASKIIE